METGDYPTIKVRSSSPQDIVQVEETVADKMPNSEKPKVVPSSEEVEEVVTAVEEDDTSEDGTETTIGETLEEVVEEVEDSEEAEDSEEGEEEEEDEDGNSYYAAATEWKKDGFIPEDVEVPKDISPTKLKELYYEHNHKSIYEEAYPAAKTEVLSSLKDLGVTESNILIAQAMDAGTPPEKLFPATRYKSYADTNLKGLSADQKEATMIEVVTERFKERNWTKEEIADRIDTLVAEGTLQSEFKTSVDFFKEKSDAFNSKLEEQYKQREAEWNQKRQKDKETWVSVSNNKKIKDEEFTEAEFKEFERAVLSPTEVVEINGQLHKIPEFEGFKHNMFNDLETQLYLFKLYKYRNAEMSSLRNKIKNEVEDEVLSGISKKTKVVKKATKTKRKKKSGDRISVRFS